MHERSVTVTAGVSRSGKSTFALRYMLNAPLAYRFIFDAEVGPQSYAERLGCDAAGTECGLDMQLLTGWVIFNPHLFYRGRLHEAFPDFCRWVFDRSTRLPGLKCLLIDEAWKYVDGRRWPAEIAGCTQGGAAHGLQCMFNTQTPHKLPEAIDNEVSELVCFKLGGEDSLKFVRRKGLDPAEIEGLAPLQYVARNIDSGGELRGRLKL